MKNVLLIDDYPELKIFEHGIDRNTINLRIAKTVNSGVYAISNSDTFDKIYLDYKLPDGTGEDVLLYLTANPDKIPKEIVCISSCPLDPYFYQKIEMVLKLRSNI